MVDQYRDARRPMNVPVRVLRRLALGAAVAACLWLLSSFAVASFLTRRPHSRFEEPVPTVGWAELRPLRLSTSDGEDLGAWFIEGRADRPVVVHLHGNRGRRSDSLHRAELLAANGCGALLLSLRAHGDSSGDHNDFGLSARHDVLSAVAWLERTQPRRPILVWGHSLGAAAAVFAGGELGDRVGGYILECPYRDLRTAVWNRTQLYLPPLLDRVAYTGLVIVSPVVLPELDEISPVTAAAKIPSTVPVLVLAGGADRRAKPEEAAALAEHMPGHTRLVLIEAGGHSRLEEADPTVYRDAVLGFVTACRLTAPVAK
jgi:pimeloyl-ACP methyl ester carboxylesterase